MNKIIKKIGRTNDSGKLVFWCLKEIEKGGEESDQGRENQGDKTPNTKQT